MPIEGDKILFPGGIELPLRPTVGLVATTPTYVQNTASDSGSYGGDIDMKELVEGSTLYLPVFVEGGLLAMGDCHAVVGDGAVGGTGAETQADVHIRVSVEKGLGLKAPRALTPEYLVTLGYGEELGPAMRQAVRDMVDFLVSEKGMEAYQAYTLLSLAGGVRVSRTFRPISPVKMMLSPAGAGTHSLGSGVETDYRWVLTPPLPGPLSGAIGLRRRKPRRNSGHRRRESYRRAGPAGRSVH